MKKSIIVLILFSCNYYAIACDCEQQKIALEFNDSEYVFKGEVINKVYSKDSLTYEITIEIIRHFKDQENQPKELKFTFKSEYDKIVTSCDFHINNSDRLLIYAKRNKDSLNFNLVCSNSKRLSNKKINFNELLILENGNNFKLNDFIYQYETGFNNPKPVSNIESIFETSLVKNYDSSFTVLKLLIDESGNLESVATYRNFYLINDPIFDLPIKFIVNDSISLSEFESDAIELARQIKQWEIKKHNNSGISISYIKNLILKFDKEKNRWEFEL